MSDNKKERKKRDTSLKHRIILDNAIEVFTKKGFEDTSMDKIAETAGVSKRTIYNHFQSKENLFQEIVKGFLAERDSIKPIEYSNTVSLEEQLNAFAKAEMYLIKDPVNRGLSKLLTSVFLMNIEFGKATRNQYAPHQNLIQWLKAAKSDGKLSFQSPQLAARIFYGLVEGCITWAALMSDGENLKQIDPILDELIAVFLSRYERVE
jgi:TetR/AcrR family transcriptional regulator, regulator of autoinduction and epiphytic fitness